MVSTECSRCGERISASSDFELAGKLGRHIDEEHAVRSDDRFPPNRVRPDPAKAGTAGKSSERKTSIGSWVAIGALVAAFVVVAALFAWMGAADNGAGKVTPPSGRKTGLARCEELWAENRTRVLENNPYMTRQVYIDNCMADDSFIRQNEGW